MRKLMIVGIALALGAGVALAQGATSGSESGPTTGPTGRPRGENDRTATVQEGGNYKEGDLRTVTLTVRHVDASKHKATVDVQVSPEANIIKNGEPIKIDQLKAGDQVRASFDTSTGELVKIRVTQKGMKSQ